MLKLLKSKQAFVVLVVTFFILLLGSVAFFVFIDSNENIDPENDPNKFSSTYEYFEQNPIVSNPDQGHIDTLKNFIDNTSDDAERAEAYYALSQVYSLDGDFVNELESLRAAKKLQDVSNFDEEITAIIDDSIVSLEAKIERSNRPADPNEEVYLGEPEE